MPTRRTMELVIVTVILLSPVRHMARVWFHKHLATSTNDGTRVAAEVGAQVV